MWYHPKKKTGLFAGSYDYEKTTGVRYFELLGFVNNKKVRFKFKSPSLAVKAGWKKVR